MIAIKRLQSIMWILLVAAGALVAYLISLQVATERNAVRHTIDQIRWTRSDIRYLEAEFGARASLRQLHAWNASDLRLYVPAPEQFLQDERALASLDRMTPVAGGYTPPPVMTAMVQNSVQTNQAEPDKAPVVEGPAPSISSEFALIRTAAASEPKVSARAVTSPVRPSSDGAAVGVRSGPSDPSVRKAARLALLDEKLLGGSMLSEARVR